MKNCEVRIRFVPPTAKRRTDTSKVFKKKCDVVLPHTSSGFNILVFFLFLFSIGHVGSVIDGKESLSSAGDEATLATPFFSPMRGSPAHTNTHRER